MTSTDAHEPQPEGASQDAPALPLEPAPAPAPPRPARGDLAVILLLIATVLVFGRVVTFDFVLWDDDMTTFSNPILNPPRWSALGHLWTNLTWNLYMPVTWTVWIATAKAAYQPGATDVGLPALNPYVFHALSLVTHVWAVLMAYRVLRILKYAPWAACAGALVFALHPLQVEPIAWSSSYNVLLCAAFSLWAIGGYLRFAETTDPKRRRRRYAWATLAFVLALLSKPMAVTVPFVVVAIDWLLLRRPLRRTLLTMAPWVIAAIALAVLTASWQGRRHHVDPMPLWTRLFVAADAVSFYLRKLVWPSDLVLDHGRMPLVALSDPHLFWKILPTLLLAAGLWVWRDRVRPALAGLAVFVAGMLPVLGLAPFDFQQYSTVADRYAYVAMLGAAIAVAWLASKLRPPTTQAWLSIALAATLGFVASAQLGRWRNSYVLFAYTTRVHPRSAVAWLNWGAALMRENRPADAIYFVRRAIAIRHDYHHARLNLGMAYFNAGDPAAGEREWRRLVLMHPTSLSAHAAMGDLHLSRGEYDAAEASYRKILELDPANDAGRARLQTLNNARAAAATTRPTAAARGSTTRPEPQRE
jgi:hypothetical protein